MAPKGRTFSKRLVVVNSLLAWGVLFYAIGTQQAAAVASYVFAFLATIASAYVGVGHMDLRMFLSTLSPSGVAADEPQEPAA